MASVPDRRLGARPRPAIGAGIVAFAALAMIVVASLPAFAGCGTLDPGCLETTAEDTATDPVGSVNGTVEDPVGTVTGTAGGAVDEVRDTIDGLLGRGSEVPPGGGGGGGNSGGDPMPPAGGRPGAGPAGRPDLVHDGARGQVALPVPNGSLAGDAPGGSVTRAPKPESGLLGQIGGAVAGVAKRLGFPMALALLVFLFAALQNRLDRNEPRMVRASMVPDVMRFG